MVKQVNKPLRAVDFTVRHGGYVGCSPVFKNVECNARIVVPPGGNFPQPPYAQKPRWAGTKDRWFCASCGAEHRDGVLTECNSTFC